MRGEPGNPRPPRTCTFSWKPQGAFIRTLRKARQPVTAPARGYDKPAQPPYLSQVQRIRARAQARWDLPELPSGMVPRRQRGAAASHSPPAPGIGVGEPATLTPPVPGSPPGARSRTFWS